MKLYRWVEINSKGSAVFGRWESEQVNCLRRRRSVLVMLYTSSELILYRRHHDEAVVSCA